METFRFHSLPNIIQAHILQISDFGSLIELLKCTKSIREHLLKRGIFRKNVTRIVVHFLGEVRDSDGRILASNTIRIQLCHREQEIQFESKPCGSYSPFIDGSSFVPLACEKDFLVFQSIRTCKALALNDSIYRGPDQNILILESIFPGLTAVSELTFWSPSSQKFEIGRFMVVSRRIVFLNNHGQEEKLLRISRLFQLLDGHTSGPNRYWTSGFYSREIHPNDVPVIKSFNDFHGYQEAFLDDFPLIQAWHEVLSKELRVTLLYYQRWSEFRMNLEFHLNNFVYKDFEAVTAFYGEKPKDFGAAPNLKQIKKILMRVPGMRLMENAAHSDLVTKLLIKRLTTKNRDYFECRPINGYLDSKFFRKHVDDESEIVFLVYELSNANYFVASTRVLLSFYD